jgi:16S rRNA (guanine527-N7)-methyltransferase
MFKELLASEFAPYAALSEEQLSRLENHFALMKQWNRRLNLTRIVDLSESVQFHYCESLFIARSLPGGSLRIVDVGSGAGFPGIPIAILRPECDVTLVESHQRKSVFLREACRDLPNVRVTAKRAEDVEEHFDWLVSRAVAPSAILQLDIAANVMLSISAEDGENLEGIFHPVPWGTQRVLFHVKHERKAIEEVPRGT